jgi:hypothetical protein
MQVRRGVARNANMLDLFNVNAGSFQAVAHRLRGKSRTVLHAIEAFFFNRGEQFSIFDDRRRCITVICVYPEDVHLEEFRIANFELRISLQIQLMMGLQANRLLAIVNDRFPCDVRLDGWLEVGYQD